MRYTLIAAALIGAVVAMPAVPASYGSEAPPAAYQAPDSYAGSENVYGTEVSNKPTTAAAAISSSTCTDEAQNIVPYTTPSAQSQVVESSAPAYGVPSKSEYQSVPAKQTDVASSSEVSPGKPAETPAGYASASKPADVASSSESSPESPNQTKPVESAPAGYAAPSGYQSMPAVVASSSEASPESPKETKSVESAPVGYAASSSVPKSPEASAPAAGTESSPESPEKPAQYGSTVVPGSAPTAAPYPVQGGDEASPVSPGNGAAAASGTAGAAKPTGTGSVGGYEQFEGAASSLSVAGLFVSFGAIAALFM